jgi:hypothetical protein
LFDRSDRIDVRAAFFIHNGIAVVLTSPKPAGAQNCAAAMILRCDESARQQPVAVLDGIAWARVLRCAFGIFRRRRFAVVAMLVFVIVPQLYTWFGVA